MRKHLDVFLIVCLSMLTATSADRTSATASRPKRAIAYGPTFRDRLWMWGHHVEFTEGRKDDGTPCFPYIPCQPGMDMAEACKSMGIPNCCVILFNPARHELKDFLPQFRDMKRVAWSIGETDAGTLRERIDRVYAAACEIPGLKTMYLDDYFVKEMGCTWDIPKLKSVKSEIAARGFNLACVLYSDQDGLKEEFLPHIAECEEVSYWFWRQQNLDGLEKSVRDCRTFIGPEKSLLLGLYMYEFAGTTKLMPPELMRRQLAVAERLMKDGTVDGLIFHCTPICNSGAEAVAISRQWIVEHGDDFWGVGAPAEATEHVFARDAAGTCWQDGVFLGDGANGVVASAPMGLEWVVNRNTLFYALTNEVTHVRHRDFLRLVSEKGYRDTLFMDELEGRDDIRLLRTLSAAVLRLKFWKDVDWGAPAAPAVSERLSLSRGELVQRLRAGEMDISVTTVVPRAADVVAIRIDSRDLGRAHTPIFELVRPENELLVAPVRTARANGVESFVQTIPGGVSYAVALALSADRREAFVAVRTSREANDPLAAAQTAAEAARAAGFAEACRANADWWEGFWEDGGDAKFASEPEVDRAWHMALYTLAASYGRAPMPGLNGLSYGPVDSTHPGLGAQFYTHDQNVQIPMFAFNPVNRVGFVKSFAETYLALLPKLRDWTRHLFEVEGVHLPLCLNQDGTERCCYRYRYTLDGAAYSGLVLATAWRYSRDTALLRSHLYPLLKEFSLFYLAFMERDSVGTYHLILPSAPPEIFRFTKDSTSILAMLRPCLETLAEGSEILGVDAGLRARCRAVLAHYPPLARHPEGGWWCGPEIPPQEPMFGGHLFYPFYPAESDLDRTAAERTLAWYWKYGADVSCLSARPHAISEWSAYYTGVAELRLHGGARGWSAVRDFLSDYGKPNGLFSHNAVRIEDPTAAEAARTRAERPWWNWRRTGTGITLNPRAKVLVPPVIEGSGAFVFLGTEALLQSWGGEIRLFPGVPVGFTGEFRDFLAQGGRRVSAKMVNGKVVWSEIK